MPSAAKSLRLMLLKMWLLFIVVCTIGEAFFICLTIEFNRQPIECAKVYIGETGRAMHERIKEHDRDLRLACTQASAVSEHANKTGHFPIWNEIKFTDRDPHWCTRMVKEAIHVRLHPNNINRDSGIEIPEAWTLTIKKHSSRSITNRTCEGTPSIRNNNEDRNAPIAMNPESTYYISDTLSINLIA